MLEDWHEIHHTEEDEQTEDDEVFHGIAVGLRAVFPFGFGASEDEGFVGVAECLGKHHHDDGYLDVGSVDTYHGSGCLFVPLEDVGDYHLAHILAEDTGHSEDEEGPGVFQHLFEQSAVDAPSAAGECGGEQEEYAEAT